MTDETVEIETSPACREFLKEASALCARYSRRITPVEMTTSLAFMAGWAIGGVSAHDKLRPAMDANIQSGHEQAVATMAEAKIAGAVKRAAGK